MKGLKKKMTGKEWREFARDITAGVFGGFVVLAWQYGYEIVKDKSFLWKIIAPNVLAVLIFIVSIFVLRWLLVEKQK